LVIDCCRRGRLVNAALAALCAVGCSDVISVKPTAHDLVVQSVLDAGSRDQWVIVQSTDGSYVGQIPVTGATVTMTLPGGATITAVERADSTIAQAFSTQPSVSVVYHFSLTQLGGGVSLVPGGTYRLRVVVPDGRVVTGQTTIPFATAALFGSDTTVFDLRRDTLTASLARVAGAARYETEIAFVGGTSLYRAFTDTALSLPGSLPVFTTVARAGPGASARVVISAVDAAYYEYYRRSGDPLSGIGIGGNLTGALGVFGSIVPVKRFALIVH
jgi:hypothetical protein